MYKKKKKKQRVRTHDVRLEVIVEMHRVHGLLDHGVDLIVADMNLAHCEQYVMGWRVMVMWVEKMGFFIFKGDEMSRKKTHHFTPGFILNKSDCFLSLLFVGDR